MTELPSSGRTKLGTTATDWLSAVTEPPGGARCHWRLTQLSGEEGETPRHDGLPFPPQTTNRDVEHRPCKPIASRLGS